MTSANRVGVRIGWWLRLLTFDAIMAFVGGWALMIAVGVIHGDWLPQVPTIGYRPAVTVVFLLGLVMVALRPSDYAVRALDDE